MAYINRRSRVSRSLNGLGDASSCGADQVWDPTATYPGLPPGQCMPRSAYSAAQLAQMDSAAKSGTVGGIASSILGALLGGFVTPKPQTIIAAPAASSGIGIGIGTGTALAIGAGVLGLVFIATR